MILQDRDVDVSDVRVRHKDQPVVACGKPRSSLDGAELQGVEPLASQSHNLKPYIRVVVLMAELSNSLSEGPAEERHVEHATAIGRLAPKVKRPDLSWLNHALDQDQWARPYRGSTRRTGAWPSGAGPFDFENFRRRDWHDAIDTAGITRPARICAPPIPHEPDSA